MNELDSRKLCVTLYMLLVISAYAGVWFQHTSV